MKLTRRLTAIAAAITTAAAAFTGTTATAQDEAPRPVVDFNTPPTKATITNEGLAWDVLTPGMSFQTDSGWRCSAGFFATDEANDPVMVTAGHCADNGRHFVWSPDSQNQLSLGTASTVVGQYPNGGSPDLQDYAVVPLDSPEQSVSPRIGNAYEVVMTLTPDDLEAGMQLCKFGMRTQETCGSYLGQNDGLLVSTTPVEEGDSGGPVYVKLGGGQVALVGITSVGADAESLLGAVPVSNILRHEHLLLNGEYGYLPEAGL